MKKRKTYKKNIPIFKALILLVMLYLSLAILILSCGGGGDVQVVSGGVNKKNIYPEYNEYGFRLPVIDENDLEFVEPLGAISEHQFCIIMDNLYTNFYPEIDGMDLARFENKQGIFDCTRIPQPWINIENPNCNNPDQETACHDDGVIHLISVKRKTGCHEILHYLLYIFDLNPSCKGLIEGFEYCSFVEHNFEIFKIQRDKQTEHLICDGALWMFSNSNNKK